MNNNQLYHYGVIGMKWGVRRYQNEDGSLTSAGKKRYGEQGQYEYKSRATKKRERKVARAEKAGKSNAEYLRKRAKASQEFDNQQLSYAKKTSVGKAFVGSSLMTPMLYRTYAMARSTGKGRAESFVRSMLDVNLGATGLSAQQYMMRESYINSKTKE